MTNQTTRTQITLLCNTLGFGVNSGSESARCFACDKAMHKRVFLVRCIDEQTAFVGPDCFSRIKAAGLDGYQPPLGGPKLFEISQQLLESADD